MPISSRLPTQLTDVDLLEKMTYSCNIIEFPSPPANKTGWPWTGENVGLTKINKTDAISLYPKVTIVTPSYNQAEFLEETIRSVLLQDYPNLEYIVIDGGSNDGSVDIIRKYENWITYWVSEPDKGQADAINKGFEQASGEFLGWINSDDYLYPGAITKMSAELEKNPNVSLVYGDVDEGLENNKFRRYGRNSTISEMLKTYSVPIPQQGSMWRSKVIKEVGGLDVRWQFVLDREFFLRVAMSYQTAYIPGELAFFRYHSNSKSISASQKYLWLKEIPLMYCDFVENQAISAELRTLKEPAMTAVYTHCSYMALKKGNLKLCIAFMFKAIKESSFVGVLLYIYKEMINGRFSPIKLPMP